MHFGICQCYHHRWARHFKNVVPQNQKAICKPRAQYAKRYCVLKLFKTRCAATINTKIASFRKNIFKAQRTQAQLFKMKNLILRKFLMITGFDPWIWGLPSTGLNHSAIRAQLTISSY